MQQYDQNLSGRRTEEIFGNTIESLLRLAIQEALADGYGLYEFDQAKGQLILTYWCGLRSSSTPVSENFGAVVSLPLKSRAGLAGVLYFGFRTSRPEEEARLKTLRRCADSIQRVLAFAHQMDSCLQIAAELVDFEAKIAELKIEDRTRDLLARGPSDGRATRSLAEHIDSVLIGVGVREELQLLLNRYSATLEERCLIAKAKRVLEQSLNCDEEQAYLHLRNASRRSRKAMREIAGDLLKREENRAVRLSA